MDRTWWRVLTKDGLLEKGMANHLIFLLWEPHEKYGKAKRFDTGKPIYWGIIGRVGHDWATELNWTELTYKMLCIFNVYNLIRLEISIYLWNHHLILCHKPLCELQKFSPVFFLRFFFFFFCIILYTGKHTPTFTYILNLVIEKKINKFCNRVS